MGAIRLARGLAAGGGLQRREVGAEGVEGGTWVGVVWVAGGGGVRGVRVLSHGWGGGWGT